MQALLKTKPQLLIKPILFKFVIEINYLKIFGKYFRVVSVSQGLPGSRRYMI